MMWSQQEFRVTTSASEMWILLGKTASAKPACLPEQLGQLPP